MGGRSAMLRPSTVKMQRPKCKTHNCNNLAEKHHKLKNGEWRYRKFCSMCRRPNRNKDHNETIGNWKRRGINLTVKEYEELNTKQNGLCAICGEKNTKGKILCVDHDHQTGKIRGLLCQRCNLVLGLMENSGNIVDCFQIVAGCYKYLQKLV